MNSAITMTHINIYIGETFRKQTNIMDDITIVHDHQRIFVALIISIIGIPINATTTGLIPLNAFIAYSLSLKVVKNIATISIIRKGGRQLAIVATTLPFVPRNLCPVRIDMFTAKSPGAVCASVIMSMKSSSLSHFLSTSSDFMAAIIGIPPPMVNAPIFAKTVNIFQSEIIFSLLKLFLTVFRAQNYKKLKKMREKFGGKEKSCTFAIPNEKRGTENSEFGTTSSLKRLEKSTRSKYREKQFIEKR